MELNKIRGGFKDPQRTFLVPISFGVSSISLLHILDQQLQSRRERGRHAGFGLHVLFVDQSTLLDQNFPQELRDMLMQRYPSHAYTTILLENCADYGVNPENLGMHEGRSLQDTIRSLQTATSRTDVVDITRRQLTIAFAKKHRFDGVFFGDTTTRLAEKTLSEAAKGRGIAVPWLTADSSVCGLDCIYPLRDLLRNELLVYAETVSPPLTPLLSKQPPEVFSSSKDTTIDGLMTQYFESVEKEYPSIVMNVVRTSSKLLPPETHQSSEVCSLCGNPIVHGNWGGEQDGVVHLEREQAKGFRNGQSLCYGCKRSASKSL